MDEVHNPGVREAIKRHSEWPTLPQVVRGGIGTGGTGGVRSLRNSMQVLHALLKSSALYSRASPPTPAQIFVEGEFIGGADIVEQMHAAGQLAELMGR